MRTRSPITSSLFLITTSVGVRVRRAWDIEKSLNLERMPGGAHTVYIDNCGSPLARSLTASMSMNHVSDILSTIESGDPTAAEQLLPLVYNELRRLAAQRLAHEAPGQTLQATALVHEAYLRLLGNENGRHWNSRGHFFAAAAEAMRRILVDVARRKHSKKREGKRVCQDLGELAPATSDRLDDILDIDASLEALAAVDREAAELVKLRYFAGLSIPEAAAALGMSPRSADLLWAYARAWLLRSLGSGNAQA